MYISIFTDELYMDIYEALPILKEWGMTHVDFRGMINGKTIENQTDEELYALKAALDEHGLKPGVIQSSLCKVHLPDAARQAREMEKSFKSVAFMPAWIAVASTSMRLSTPS